MTACDASCAGVDGSDREASEASVSDAVRTAGASEKPHRRKSSCG